ncbi:conserved phage C-terminal domain-containing protein, partial [Bacillus wiedmannii]
MSNYNMIRTIISQISGQENIVVVPKLFVKLTGDLTTAILLNQIVFYSDKSKRTDGYFYKSHKEWEEEICLTKRQVSYSTAKLKEMGLVETKLMKANGAPTLHYKLDYDKLVQWIVTNCNNGKSQNVTIDYNNMSQSLTEITTETTTETTTEITTLKDNMPSDQKERSKDCIPYEDIVS